MAQRFTLSRFEFFVLRTGTRFPFRYGIASMTDVPQLFVSTRLTLSEKSTLGLTAEGLPPKWFAKDPATTFEQDLPEMLETIKHATELAEKIAAEPILFFDFWKELYRQQSDWAKARTLAPLLANLGVSLVERAVLDGLCRLEGESLHCMVANNRLDLRLSEIYEDLGTAHPHKFLPATPLEKVSVRHTVGLGDALTPADILPGEDANDGLPQDLESSIRAYGLRYFKVKLSGVLERDLPRLRELARLLERETGGAIPCYA